MATNLMLLWPTVGGGFDFEKKFPNPKMVMYTPLRAISSLQNTNIRTLKVWTSAGQ